MNRLLIQLWYTEGLTTKRLVLERRVEPAEARRLMASRTYLRGYRWVVPPIPRIPAVCI